MVDYEKIGKRILEERKYLHRISQEKMAEDLGMYQADISNLEKAKSGSGITDLTKLERIADYFDMPLETLLFGRRQDEMEKYQGLKMQLRPPKKKRTRKHETILRRLMGIDSDEKAEQVFKHLIEFECGPYAIYGANEFQIEFTGKKPEEGVPNYLLKIHLYVIYQDEVIGCMVADTTTLMQHIYRPAFEKLKVFIQPDIFDLDETIELLNPFWLLFQCAANEEEEEHYRQELLKRMDALRSTGENRALFYVENAYVREDCRKNGIFRMMIDVLKKLGKEPMIWLSLEPTSGSELNQEYSYHPRYEASELGQIHLNASIAEHLGFFIDSATEDRQTERIGEDGSTRIETVPVRRTAYYLPKAVRTILRQDRDILTYARARKEMAGGNEPGMDIVDIYQGAWKKYGFIFAVKMVFENETVFAFARGMDWESRFLGVSRENPAETGAFVDTIEKYDQLEEAVHSQYYQGLKMAEQFLGAIFFGTVEPENVGIDEYQEKSGLFDKR